jgi:hypothetical protein
MPLIPTTWEKETGRTEVWDHPGLYNETVSNQEKKHRMCDKKKTQYKMVSFDSNTSTFTFSVRKYDVSIKSQKLPRLTKENVLVDHLQDPAKTEVQKVWW